MTAIDDLARALNGNPAEEPETLRLPTGTVTARTLASRTATVALAGGTTVTLPCIGAVPAVGDVVAIASYGPARLIIGSFSALARLQGSTVVTTNGSGDATVSFGETFPAIPIIEVSNGDGAASPGHPSIVSRTTTSFTFRWHSAGAAVTGTTVRCDWRAEA